MVSAPARFEVSKSCQSVEFWLLQKFPKPVILILKKQLACQLTVSDLNSISLSPLSCYTDTRQFPFHPKLNY